ncbi:hypothetical protein K457DRAFT_135694, partial [Linnemannia elongata AG-77]
MQLPEWLSLTCFSFTFTNIRLTFAFLVLSSSGQAKGKFYVSIKSPKRRLNSV